MHRGYAFYGRLPVYTLQSHELPKFRCVCVPNYALNGIRARVESPKKSDVHTRPHQVPPYYHPMRMMVCQWWACIIDNKKQKKRHARLCCIFSYILMLYCCALFLGKCGAKQQHKSTALSMRVKCARAYTSHALAS